jgi:hypothetical protein
MKVYSDFVPTRAGQVLGDAASIGVLAVSVWAAIAVRNGIAQLASIGKNVEDAGTGFRKTMADAGSTLGGIPLIGDGARAPFDSASDAGKSLADAGSTSQSVIGDLATIVAVIVVLIPVIVLGRYWFLRRIRFTREASVAHRLASTEAGIDLLALRALAGSDGKDVLRIHPAAAMAWRSGDADVIRRLAALHLRDSGVKVRSAPASAG